jgi:molybdate transport system substrate-binding protein
MNGEPGGDAVRGISSMATRHVLAELCDAYARQTGQRVDVLSVGGVEAIRRVQQGEAFDFVVLATEAIARLASTGHVDSRTRSDLARSEIAIAVRAGSRRPDIGSERAVRDAVQAARSIGYSTGPSGTYLVRLFERWGIADTLAPRLVQAPPGVPVGTLVARGDVELGFQQTSELLHVEGIDVVGLLPAAIRHATIFCGAVCTAAARPQSAQSLLAFLASDGAVAAKRRHGLEPVTQSASGA